MCPLLYKPYDPTLFPLGCYDPFPLLSLLGFIAKDKKSVEIDYDKDVEGDRGKNDQTDKEKAIIDQYKSKELRKNDLSRERTIKKKIKIDCLMC